MTFDEYISAVESDACRAIDSGDYDYCSDVDDVIDEMWIDDSITGNGSGSYTFSTYEAERNVKDLLFDGAFLFEVEGLGMNVGDMLKEGAEAIDVTARCLALSYARDEIEAEWDIRNDRAEHEWRVSLAGPAGAPYKVTETYDGTTNTVTYDTYYCESLNDVYEVYAEAVDL